MRLKFYLPLGLFLALVIAFSIGLTLNPREIPSALIGKPVPDFDMPPLPGYEEGLSTADFTGGEVAIVNVFASWCRPCREEHPVFMEFARTNDIPIYGINYRDDPENALAWLRALGDPYTKIGADLDGRQSIEWGIYGVPETFVVDGAGTIIFKHVAQVTPKLLRRKLVTLIEQARAEDSARRNARAETEAE